MRKRHSDQGTPFLSYGFRPFFLCAALFAGTAVPLWIALLTGSADSRFLFEPREWHVHEMLFGFLAAVITGFLLTAMPNWTERRPLSGLPLLVLLTLWLAGRLVIAVSWLAPLVSAMVDGAFLVVLAAIVWREIAMGKAWDRAPIGVLISLFAGANIVFHMQALSGSQTDVPERMALALIMMLFALIGGRVTPSFTGDYMTRRGMTEQPPPFSRIDGLAILLSAVAAVLWIAWPHAMGTGLLLMAAGLANLFRLSSWRGWMTWREPLVLILHVGYGWLAFSLLVVGGAIVGLGLQTPDAVHALTTGAVGSMTLAIMTRASLGHTGRPLHAGSITVVIYILVNLGALLRVFGIAVGLPMNLMLDLAAATWSGAYLLFAVIYGPLLIRPSIDE